MESHYSDTNSMKKKKLNKILKAVFNDFNIDSVEMYRPPIQVMNNHYIDHEPGNLMTITIRLCKKP
jgi:hypothetical protein